MKVIPFESGGKKDSGNETNENMRLLMEYYELQEKVNTIELKISKKEEKMRNLSYLENSGAYRLLMEEKMQLEYEKVITEKRLFDIMEKMMEDKR